MFNTESGQLLVYKGLWDDEEASFKLVFETTVWEEGYTARFKIPFDKEGDMDSAYEMLKEDDAEVILKELIGQVNAIEDLADENE